MRFLFCGDRFWADIQLIQKELETLPKDTVIIVGGATGADNIAYRTAKYLSLTVEVFKAEWTSYGLAAGPIRNKRMLESGVDKVFAFHDNFNNSKGTKNCVHQAIMMGIEVDILGHGKRNHFDGKKKTAKEEM